MPHLDKPASDAFWTSRQVTVPQIKQVLKVRYRQFWNVRIAFPLSMPYFRGDPAHNHFRCPLCGDADSNSHMLGECKDKDMKSIFIERHNEAARLILAEISKGQAGNCIVCADVGKEAKVASLAIKHTRISESIISKRTFSNLGMATSERDKLRPDALIIESLPQETISDTLGKTDKQDVQGQHKPSRYIRDAKADSLYRPRKAYIIEVGYGAEIRCEDKLKEKQNQHAQLKTLLLQEGFA